MIRSPIPKWKNETVVILACGPSLSLNDVNYVRGKARVIAINDSYTLAPWADILFASDARWWRYHDWVKDFRGQRWTHDHNGSTWRAEAIKNCLNVVDAENGSGISKEPGKINLGANSGFQALNFAYLTGANKVVLSGFDCGVWNSNDTHFFGKHPDSLERASPYGLFRQHFDEAAKDLVGLGISVTNCSRLTTLQCFDKDRLINVL